MRRSTPNCAFIAEQRDRLLRSLDSVDQQAIIRILEGFATPERRARLLSVFDARLDAVTVVMDAPHDPHNGAAVLRSCDAFGLQRLHVVERSERFLSSRTVSRGSERWVDVRTYRRSQDAIEALEASGHELVATHPLGELVPSDLRSIPKMALVLGNERDGIHEELSRACRRSVRIPMRGFAESLNVSVTAAILFHNATDGRPGDLSELERTKLYARALILTVPHAAEVLEARGITVETGERGGPEDTSEGKFHENGAGSPRRLED